LRSQVELEAQKKEREEEEERCGRTLVLEQQRRAVQAPPVLARAVAHDAHLDDVDRVARRRAAEAGDAARDEVRADPLVEVLREVALEPAHGEKEGRQCCSSRSRRGSREMDAQVLEVVVRAELRRRKDARPDRRRHERAVEALDALVAVDLGGVISQRALGGGRLEADLELRARE